MLVKAHDFDWSDGITTLLKSNFARLMFLHLRPEDKEKFIAESIIEEIIEAIKDEQNKTGAAVKTNAYLKNVIKELKSEPYVTYCVLRYPNFF